MRHNLLEFDDAKKKLVRTHHPRVVPPEAVQLMAALVKASTRDQVHEAFAALGASLGADSLPSLELGQSSLYWALCRYVVVIVGVDAKPYWKAHTDIGAKTACPYDMSLCGFCAEAALHCTCERQHAAFISLGLFSPKPSRPPRWGGNKAQRAAARAMACQSPSQPDSRGESVFEIEPRLDKPVEQLLRALDLADFISTFAEQEITMNVLATTTIADMRAVLPARRVTFGKVSELLRLARDPVALASFLLERRSTTVRSGTSSGSTVEARHN